MSIVAILQNTQVETLNFIAIHLDLHHVTDSEEIFGCLLS